uniref:(northern house mosquito) hypothetical protein n=1 Tax=Culex pipiens TaxID=7175 RepID=A0A8D8I7S9_CULPI
MLVLLDKLLCRLKETDHRMLIFFQMRLDASKVESAEQASGPGASASNRSEEPGRHLPARDGQIRRGGICGASEEEDGARPLGHPADEHEGADLAGQERRY